MKCLIFYELYITECQKRYTQSDKILLVMKKKNKVIFVRKTRKQRSYVIKKQSQFHVVSALLKRRETTLFHRAIRRTREILIG